MAYNLIITDRAEELLHNHIYINWQIDLRMKMLQDDYLIKLKL